MTKIIGISGKRESGKSTLAKFLEGDFEYVRVSLANPLKEMCGELYGLTENQLYGTEKEAPTGFKRTDGSPLTARDILIREGCLKRSIDPDFWCKQLHSRIEMGRNLKIEKFVIDDIRFLNEINYLKKAYPGAKFVRLERSQDAIGKAALDDLSEVELDSFKNWDGLLIEDLNRTPADLKLFAEYLSVKL